MKVFAPITLAATGGTSSFARKFRAGMAARGHAVTFSHEPDYDVLLVIVSCPWRYLLEARRLQRPIFHRLDGVYYPASIAGRLYPLYNARMKIIHRLLADITVYQSVYSQKCVEYFLGKPHSRQQHIIYNGVDTTHFTPSGPVKRLRQAQSEPVFITWSRFRRRDQIEPLLAAFQYYQRHYHPAAQLYILGNFSGTLSALPQRRRHLLQVHFGGPVTHQELPAYARGADVFVLTHLNPPCPNNVIEAMACGLPICGIADGAMPELVRSGYNGQLLETTGDAFRNARQLDPAKVAATMHTVWQQRVTWGKASRQQAEAHFTLPAMIDGYLQTLPGGL